MVQTSSVYRMEFINFKCTLGAATPMRVQGFRMSVLTYVVVVVAFLTLVAILQYRYNDGAANTQ